MTYIHSCSLYCERPECVKAQRDEMRDGIKRHEEMAAMASAEIADLTAELARLRAQKPAAWVRQYHHSGVLCWENEGGNCAPLYRAAPPAQPAEPVQRLSDERAAFEAWHNEYRTQELVRRDDTYYNTHVRCRWEGWQARAIESALQPGWRDIESAPKDGTRIILGSSDGAWMAEYQPVYQSGYRPDNPWFSVMLNHAHMGRFPKAKPTHWQPIPPAPKATK